MAIRMPLGMFDSDDFVISFKDKEAVEKIINQLETLLLSWED